MNIRAFYKKPNLKRMLFLLFIALLFWLVLAWFIQRPMLFPVWMIPEGNYAQAPPDATPYWHLTGDDRIESWLFMGKGVSGSHPGPLVIYAHGNAELIDHWARELAHYTDQGISVLLIEYRGYGRSTGSPSEKNIVADFTALSDQVIALPQVDATRVIYHGRSLGGGIVSSLARKRPPAAMILESTFTSVSSMAWSYALPGFMTRDPLNTRGVLKKYTRPVLIMHGQEDEIIPVSHARSNHQACPQSQLIVYPRMTHNSGPPDYDAYWQNIFKFLVDAKMIDASQVPAPKPK